MSPQYAKNLFKKSGFKNIKINYRFFIPNKFNSFLYLENYLKNIPIGANYYLVAKNNI
jgi:hypothetical protein